MRYQNPAEGKANKSSYQRRDPALKTLVGVDVFVHERNDNPDYLASRINAITPGALALQMITNRGIKVWPEGFPETFCTDHWRCRYMITSGSQTVTPKDVLHVLGQLTEAGIDVIKTENLYTFDGELGFALGQGQ